MDRRQLLLSVFQQGLAAVNGRSCVRSALTEPRAPRGAWNVIAVGKAASAMTLGAFDALGPQIEDALVISKAEHFDAELRSNPKVQCLTASHPVPDESSLAAGATLLARIDRLPRAHRVLFLVSGGASSLVESLPDGVTLDRLVQLNEWGLSAGLDIRALNSLRRRISAIKGGKLLKHLAGRDVLALFISDVPGDDPNLIGSGLLGSPVFDRLPADLPQWLQHLIREEDVISEGQPARIDRRVIANLEAAVGAVRSAATARGLSVSAAGRRFDGDAVDLASRFCHELEFSDVQLHVWAGESTVRLPATPGRGGRNQHLALAAARLLVGHDDLLVLAAGTDGTDGNTIDAGGLVDGQTAERGTVDGLDIDDCLARADSARFLDSSGDLVHTGPTGTNVGDLLLGLKVPA